MYIEVRHAMNNNQEQSAKSIHTAKSLYSRVPEKVGSISCKIVTGHLYKDQNGTCLIHWDLSRTIHTWYRSNEFVIATGSPLHSWQMPALRRMPLTLYLRRLLLIDWRAIASKISVAFGYLTKPKCG
jgi:hypothetical protein